MTNQDTTAGRPDEAAQARQSPEPTPDAQDEARAEAQAAAEEPVPAPLFTEAEVEARLAAASADAKDRYLRLAAEYDNFRRRVAREREQWSAEAVERFALDMIEVLDNFDRALAAKSDDPAAVHEGVRVTEKVLRGALARHGVESIDAAGQMFDPRLHEAVLRAPAADKAQGTVLAVFEKGYTLNGRMLRPARVQVAGGS
jgi:molecular chaperone GrpE